VVSEDMKLGESLSIAIIASCLCVFGPRYGAGEYNRYFELDGCILFRSICYRAKLCVLINVCSL
jgi:hypothetical protein